ncbi:hypothetical protein [Winogradskya humida]|uniref:Uncharacterized protein n=1 Tax=Winogradskya humida TaxID=113566 RepID=A0ABQ3ZSY2_9ACTN|nr:hypothetical protein [Actinoplanes humidus]GIE21292.1 hypothetical protein Ahu01nite_043940 [Actinoplanes humidus]
MGTPLSRVDASIEVEYNVLTIGDATAEPGSVERPYENGLVTAVSEGDGTVAVIVTGARDDEVHVVAELWAAEPPAPAPADWQDAAEVEISWPGGPVRLLGADVDPRPDRELATGAEPGRYLLRVAGRHRDEGEARLPDAPVEDYLLQIWPAAREPAGLIKATSALGAQWRES